MAFFVKKLKFYGQNIIRESIEKIDFIQIKNPYYSKFYAASDAKKLIDFNHYILRYK